jgi:hypothetical protein
MMTYTKLFGSILDSTVWQEPLETRVVWITMLAMSDRDGKVEASVPGLAKRAGVTLSQCEKALARFKAPDQYSRTKEHEGRRIEDTAGGFILLNHGKYRSMMSQEDRREYQRLKQAEYRSRKKKQANGLPGEPEPRDEHAFKTNQPSDPETAKALRDDLSKWYDTRQGPPQP